VQESGIASNCWRPNRNRDLTWKSPQKYWLKRFLQEKVLDFSNVRFSKFGISRKKRFNFNAGTLKVELWAWAQSILPLIHVIAYTKTLLYAIFCICCKIETPDFLHLQVLDNRPRFLRANKFYIVHTIKSSSTNLDKQLRHMTKSNFQASRLILYNFQPKIERFSNLSRLISINVTTNLTGDNYFYFLSCGFFCLS